MNSKPVAVFGVIGFMCSEDENSSRNTKLNKDGMARSGYYFYTKGHAVNKVRETGETFDRFPGWLNYENMGKGAQTLTGTELTIDISYSEPTEWLCLPSDQNHKGFPDLKSVVLKPGEELSLPNGSNLFLARGQVSINNKTFTGPYQLRIRSGDVIVKSVDESYSLRVTKNENKGVA